MLEEGRWTACCLLHAHQRSFVLCLPPFRSVRVNHPRSVSPILIRHVAARASEQEPLVVFGTNYVDLSLDGCVLFVYCQHWISSLFTMLNIIVGNEQSRKAIYYDCEKQFGLLHA